VEGDAEAFGELVRRHRNRLWAVALRTTADPEEAADALQDALLSAFRRAEQFRGDSAVTTWLHRIVVNACLDRARRNKVRASEPLPEADESAPPGRHASVEEHAERVDQRQAVLTALRTLPVDQRAALVLVDMEGYSVDEAARMLGVRPARSRAVLSRACPPAATARRLADHLPGVCGTDRRARASHGGSPVALRVRPTGHRPLSRAEVT
jgi:RNA polymerase sigma-70 factor (ECF subfamily)